MSKRKNTPKTPPEYVPIKQNDKWDQFDETLRKTSGALSAITLFLIEVIFFVQLVWAHLPQQYRNDADHNSRPPVVQQNDEPQKEPAQPLLESVSER